MEPDAIVADSRPNIVDKPVIADTSVTNTQVGQDVADIRATKAKFGIASLDMSPDQVSQMIKQGSEDVVRQYAASKIDSLKTQQRLDLVDKVAAAKGGPLTPIELGGVYTKLRELTKNTDPKTIFEDYYSQAYTDLVKKVAENMPDSDVSKAFKDSPETSDKIRLMGATWLTRNEIKLNTLQNLQAQGHTGSSWTEWLIDTAKATSPIWNLYVGLTGGQGPTLDSYLPGYTDLNLRGKVPGTSFFSGATLGINLQNQFDALNKMPLDQFKIAYPKIIEELQRKDPQLALRFATAMLGQSTSEQAFNDLTTAIDASIISPVAAIRSATKLGAYSVNALRAASKTTVDGLKASTRPVATQADIFEAMGDLKTAAQYRAADNFVADAKGVSDPTKRALEAAAGVFNKMTSAFKGNVGNLDQAIINDIEAKNTMARNNLMESFLTNMRVDRIPTVMESREAQAAISEEAKNLIRGPGLDDTVLNASSPYKDAFTTGLFVDVYLGKSDKTLFGNLKDATTFKNKYLRLLGTVEEDAEAQFVRRFPKQVNGEEAQGPVQKGAGYYVKISVPVDETGTVMRDLVFQTMEKTPDSRINALIGRVRTPADTLSKDSYENRLISAVAPSNFLNDVRAATKDVRKLSRSERKDFELMLNDVAKDPIKNLIESPVELNHYYWNRFQRDPSAREVSAYFAYRRGEAMWQVFHKVNAISKKTRLGELNHTFSAIDGETASAYTYKSIKADGTLLKSSSEAGDDTLLIMGKNVGEEGLDTTKHYFSTKAGKIAAEKIDKGEMQLVRLSEPGSRPFAGFGKVTSEHRVRYVLAEKVESGSLRWDFTDSLTPPAQDLYEHYVGQARVRFDPISKKHWYENDAKILADNIGARARDVAARLDTVRLLIKEGKFAEAEAANPLEEGFSQVKEWFDKGHLSLDEPIRAIPRGKLTGELDSSLVNRYGRDSFRDGTTEGYGRFFKNGDSHDLYSYERSGTTGNPLYKLTPVKTVDPIKTLNKSTTRLINDLYLDSYKIFSVEHWIQEAKKLDLLDVDPAHLAESPYYYFWNADRFIHKGANFVTKQNMLNAQYQVRQFIGVTDDLHNWVHSVAQGMADSLFTRGFEKTALVPAYLLPKLRDPASFIRSVTFHAQLGLLAPAQFIAQSQSYANIWAIAGPKYAAPGTKAGLLHQYSRWNASPEILERLDKIASMGMMPGTATFRPGEWLEARKMGLSTGYFNVAGEYALRDNIFSLNAINSGGISDRVLNPMAFLFTEGERNIRIGSWYTAFKEFRDVNPVKAITEVDKRSILLRADTLNTNMTRAANSRIQEGLLSIPTQFLTYQLRLSEQMWGKRLTTAERMRMVTVYSALYGLPVGASLTGLPIADIVNKNLKENGYNVGNLPVADFLLKGVPEALAGYATGQWYDIPGRYGPPGLEPLKEMIHSDPSILKMVGGASGTMLGNTIGNLYPFWNLVTHWARDDNKKITPTMDNLLDIWRETSVGNSIYKLYTALNTGKLVTRNDNYVMDVNTPNAIFQFLSGLSPQKATDSFDIKWAADEAKDTQSHYLQKFIKEWRRGMVAEDQKNFTQANQFYANAKAYLDIGDYPLEKRMDALSIAMKGYESFADRMNRTFNTQDVPVSQRQKRLDAYQNYIRSK